MTSSITYQAFLCLLFLGIGIALFLLSQYFKFNLFTLLILGGGNLVILGFLPGIRTYAETHLNRPESLTILLSAGVLFAVGIPMFIHFFEYRGFGPGKNLIRSLEKHGFTGVILTFDDGPSARWTEKIIATLKKHQAPALFFIVGKHGEENPEIMKLLRDSEMEIGVHSYSHRPLPFLPTKWIEAEIDDTIGIIRASGGEPRFFRPPWGLYNREVLEIAQSRGLITVLWSSSVKDWLSPKTEKIIERTFSNLTPGEVILLHDGHPPGASRESTAEALPVILEKLSGMNIPVVSPEDLRQ